PSPPPGSHRRTGPPDQDREWEQDRRQTGERHPEVAWTPPELQQIWQLPAYAGLSRRLTRTPFLPDWARGGGRGVHHRTEVFLRREFRDSQSGGACQRRPVAGALHGAGRRAAHREWRVEQAWTQRFVRSWNPLRHPLAQRYGHLVVVGGSGCAQLPQEQGRDLQRALHGAPAKIRWDDGHHLQHG